MIQKKILRRTLAALGLLVLVAACAVTAPGAHDAIPTALAAASREAALAAVIPMPDAGTYQTQYLEWTDAERQRAVNCKLYLPAHATSPVPLVVFSHGLGGSREGYSYLGKYFAAHGYASLHVQHPGSDRSIWIGNPITLIGRLQTAASNEEAIARVQDLKYALNHLLTNEYGTRIDASRIAAAGHSYGANSTMLLAGATVDGQQFSDPRIQAAILISSPPFYGQSDLHQILTSIHIPTLHITSTGDEIVVPGYHSSPEDRIKVFDAMGSRSKNLAVFKDGSHSMFTDRLGTGGAALNPTVKIATRELALAFLQRQFEQKPEAMTQWPQQYQALLARFE